MGLVIGPSKSHSSYVPPFNWSTAALGSTVCGGRLFCKSGGIAWIVAPAATQVTATWNGTTNTLVGNKPNVSDWSSLSTALTNAGLTPSQWFVPSVTQLQSGRACKSYWDSYTTGSGAIYWSSTEYDSTHASYVHLTYGDSLGFLKTNTYYVRAFRCVTY
jgi:hypothetical protein